ncbi:hypothetical protein B0H15DRAFT_776652, partial [Mycena belliarum]
NPGNNLHVSGLGHKIDTRDLEAAFAKIGRVKKASVMYDPHTRESRGFGFVTMESGEEADAAIAALHGTELGGKVRSFASISCLLPSAFPPMRLLLLTDTHLLLQARRGRARTPTPGRYYGPPKRGDSESSFVSRLSCLLAPVLLLLYLLSFLALTSPCLLVFTVLHLLLPPSLPLLPHPFSSVPSLRCSSHSHLAALPSVHIGDRTSALGHHGSTATYHLPWLLGCGRDSAISFCSPCCVRALHLPLPCGRAGDAFCFRDILLIALSATHSLLPCSLPSDPRDSSPALPPR